MAQSEPPLSPLWKIAQSEPPDVFVSYMDDTLESGSPMSEQQLLRITEKYLSSQQSDTYRDVATQRIKVRANSDIVRAASDIVAAHGTGTYRPRKGGLTPSVLRTALGHLDTRWATLTDEQAKKALSLAKAANAI